MTSSRLKSKREQRKAFVLLKRMCRAHARLPSSYVIEGGIECEGSHACALGGAADVWKGRYCGKLVAIKSLRICRPQGGTEDGVGNGDKKVDKDMRRLMQVRLLMLLLSKTRKVDECVTEVLPRSCDLETTFPPEPPSIPWRQQDIVPPRDGIRMDESWDNPSIRERERGDKSAETGTHSGPPTTSSDSLDIAP